MPVFPVPRHDSNAEWSMQRHVMVLAVARRAENAGKGAKIFHNDSLTDTGDTTMSDFKRWTIDDAAGVLFEQHKLDAALVADLAATMMEYITLRRRVLSLNARMYRTAKHMDKYSINGMTASECVDRQRAALQQATVQEFLFGENDTWRAVVQRPIRYAAADGCVEDLIDVAGSVIDRTLGVTQQILAARISAEFQRLPITDVPVQGRLTGATRRVSGPTTTSGSWLVGYLGAVAMSNPQSRRLREPEPWLQYAALNRGGQSAYAVEARSLVVFGAVMAGSKQ